MARIFVGIPVGEELGGEVLRWQEKFQISNIKFQRTLTPNPSPKGRGVADIRWIAPRNLHVTLVAPWETKEWKAESKKLKVIQFPSFEIGFNQITVGPDEYRPRMIWATGEAGEEIGKLKKLIEISLGKKPEPRAFASHVTLARIMAGDIHKTAHEWANFKAGIDWHMLVKKFVLYQSRLLPEGAEYQVLAEFGLGV